MPVLISPQKLREAVEASYRRLRFMREQRAEATQELAGRFSYRSDNIPRYRNQIAKCAGTLIPHIAGRHAEHEVTSELSDLTGEGKIIAMALDRHYREVNRRDLSRACLQDAFLGPAAIVYCAMRSGANMVKFAGRNAPAGTPLLQRISLDDYVCDPSATSRESMLWEGHYYTLPRELAIESGVFDPAIEHVPLVQDCYLGARGRNADISAGEISLEDRYGLIDTIMLLDIAIYDEGTTYIVTLSAEEGYDSDWLAVEEYQGPRRGPYEHLVFHPMNDQPLGKPPVADWREAADAYYAIVNAIVTQAKQTKKVVLSERGAPETEIDAINDAQHGDHLVVENMNAHGMLDLGGVSKDLLVAAQMLDADINISAHNVDLLAGKSNSSTATQYSGDHANATAIIDNYRETNEEFEGRLSEHVAWHLLSDPTVVLPMPYRVPGGEYVQVVYDAQTRRGDYQNFRYRIKANSTLGQDPNVKTLRVMQFFDTLIKAAETSMATGGMIDVAGWARKGGELIGAKDLHEIVLDPLTQMQGQMLEQMVPQRTQGQIAGPAAGKPQGSRVQPSAKAGAKRGASPSGQVRSAQPQLAGA